MKIKQEFKGKKIIKSTTLGNITVVIDNIDVKRYQYYVSIGLGYIFEKENETTTQPEQCIKYEGIDQEEEVKPIAKRKRKPKTTEE